MNLDYAIQSPKYHALNIPNFKTDFFSTEEDDSAAFLTNVSGFKQVGRKRDARTYWYNSTNLIRPIGPRGIKLSLGLLEGYVNQSMPIDILGFSHEQLLEFSDSLRSFNPFGIEDTFTYDDPAKIQVNLDRPYERLRQVYYDTTDFPGCKDTHGNFRRRLARCDDLGYHIREANGDDLEKLSVIMEKSRAQIEQKGETWHEPLPGVFSQGGGFRNLVLSDPDRNIRSWQVVFSDQNLSYLAESYSTYDNNLGFPEVTLYKILEQLFFEGHDVVHTGLDHLRLRQHKEKFMQMRTFFTFNTRMTPQELSKLRL
jgi:hypothetical protein